MKSEKEKLQAKSVNALKAAAKRIGANVIDPKTGKAKTKEQLIRGIVMKQNLTGKSMGGNAKPTTAKAKTTNAKDLNIKIRENKAELKKLAANIKIFEQGIAALKKRLSL
jgi:hypothetical protein